MPDENTPPAVNEPPKKQGKADLPPAPPKDKVEAPGLSTPVEHAIATGNARRFTPPVAFGRAGEQPQPVEGLAFSAEHASAAALHGWGQHEHHEGEPIKLSRADYEAALKAAATPVTRVRAADGRLGEPLDAEAAEKHAKSRTADKGEIVTDYEPHDAALSKHSHLAQLRKAAEAK
jgi:hypothetical protein